MHKLKTFLTNFRQTDGYRGISYTTYLGILSLCLTYAFFTFIGLMQGMGALLGVIGLVAVLGLLNILIIIFLIIGILQTKKAPQRKTNILHDIGVVICLICYLMYGYLMINGQTKRMAFKEGEHVNRIGMALTIMGKDCDEKIDKFTPCFAEYFNTFEKVTSVDKNVIITNDNKKYVFYVNHNCENKECYVEISKNEQTAPSRQVVINYNPSYLSPWDIAENK